MKRNFLFLLVAVMLFMGTGALAKGKDEGIISQMWPCEDGGFLCLKNYSFDQSPYLSKRDPNGNTLWEVNAYEPEDTIRGVLASVTSQGNLGFVGGTVNNHEAVIRVYNENGEQLVDKLLLSDVSAIGACENGCLVRYTDNEDFSANCLYNWQGQLLYTFEPDLNMYAVSAIGEDFLLSGRSVQEKIPFVLRITPKGELVWQSHIDQKDSLAYMSLLTAGEDWILAETFVSGNDAPDYTDCAKVIDAHTGKVLFEQRFLARCAHGTLKDFESTEDGLVLTMGFVDVVRTPTTGVDLLDKGLRKLGLQTKENFDGLVTFVFDKEGSIVYTQYSAFPSGVDIQGVVKSGGKTYAYGGYKGEEFREYLGEYMLEKADWTAVEAMNYVPVSQ